jgi:hypothetical protein
MRNSEKKEKILLCWNQNQYAEVVESRLKELGCEVMLCTEYSSIEKLSNKDWESIKHIIVLCELKWSGKLDNNAAMSGLKGIELVQKDFRVNKELRQPILFLSFLKRKEIQQINPINDIVSAKGLQHGFKRLPSIPEEWISILREMRPLTELEWRDTLHFCQIGNMAAEIRHDAMRRNLSKDEFTALVFKLQHLIRGENILNQLNDKLIKIENYLDTEDWEGKRHNIKSCIKDVCDEIEYIVTEEHSTNKSENRSSSKPDFLKYKILWLEDEPKTIEILANQSNAKNIFDFIIVQTPKELYEEIENDKDNNISLIICDNRIKGINKKDSEKDDTPVLLEQGYTCIQNIHRDYRDRYYKYILLSELPRDFKLKISEVLKFDFFNKSKKIDLANTYNFICFLEKEAKTVRESVEKKGFTNANFIRFYNHLKTMKNDAISSFENIEKDIERRALALINYYKEHDELGIKHFDRKTYIRHNKIVDEETIKDCFIRNFPNSLNEHNNNEGDDFCYCYPNGLLHNISVDFGEKRTKSGGSDIKQVLISLIQKMLNICIVENWKRDNCQKTELRNKLPKDWGKGIGDISIAIIIDSFTEEYRKYGRISAEEYVKMIQERSDYHKIKSEFLYKKSIKDMHLPKKKKVDYIHKNENDLDNIYAFLSKLVARRVAQYLYTQKDKDDNSKPLTLKQLYGFFGKGSEFGSHDLDLQLSKNGKETIEEKIFREELITKI